MSLIEDIKKHYETKNSPPHGYVDAECVSEEVIGQRRWGSETEWVFKRGDEYVAVFDVAPTTEMQDWGDYGEPDIYPVKPVEVTTVKYEKV